MSLRSRGPNDGLPSTRRSYLVPEVLQASTMDCGPATLAAVLRGYGMAGDYEELRSRCRTDVDGTSIDALALLGSELGLHAQQLLVPQDHLLLSAARCLPAIALVRSPSGPLHFVVLWRRLGAWVQVLDPQSGRTWLPQRKLLQQLAEVPLPLSAARFRRWACSRDAQAPWQARASQLGISRSAFEELFSHAAADPGWRGFATLDAGLRMVADLVQSGACRRGAAAGRCLRQALDSERSCRGGQLGGFRIPPSFWWVSEQTAQAGMLCVRGTVVVHCRPRSPITEPVRPAQERPRAGSSADQKGRTRALPPARGHQEPRVVRPLARALLEDAGLRAFAIVFALLASGLAAPLEALLLSASLGQADHDWLGYQRATQLAAIVALLVAAACFDLWATLETRRLGTRFEARLRRRLLEKLPRLADDQVSSRPTSDLAEREHSLHLLREVPSMAFHGTRSALQVVLGCGALVWLYPQGWGLACAVVATSLALPFWVSTRSSEANLRLRTQQAALERFHLDALLGATPLRVHAAQSSVRSEHEGLLSQWLRAAHQVHRENTGISVSTLLTTTTLVAALVVRFALDGPTRGAELLLMTFWALRLPASGAEFVSFQQSWRGLRVVALRLLSLLSVAESSPAGASRKAAEAVHGAPHIEFVNVGAERAGCPVLRGIDLTLSRGEHVAVVGASGAGKSSLLGVLLGWFQPSRGQVLVDGAVLQGERRERLRRATAWLDPSVQLWSGSLLDNIRYGAEDSALCELPAALERSDSLEVLEALPQGLRSPLGESGARLSGGQGQRVRMARAWLASTARLVLMDEPFRGLERSRRRVLCARARAHWKQATLLHVSHDVADSLEFDRVLVVAGGRIVEDGKPKELLGNAKSQFAQLFHQEEVAQREVWGSASWRKCELSAGRLRDSA